MALATAAGAASLAWGVAETRMFALRTQVLPILPAGRRPLRLLHISDLHMLPWQHRKKRWVAQLASLEPDIIVNTGDNLGHPEALSVLAEALGPLLNVPGVFVLGSNDFYSPRLKNPASYLRTANRHPRSPGREPDLPTAELIRLLQSGGWVHLDNARSPLTVGSQPLSVVGLLDPHIGINEMPPALPNGSSDEVRLGVVHAPYTRVLDAMHDDGCHLMLAGHTHGGQLCLPGYGALVTNCDIDTGRASGLHGWPGPRPDERGGGASTWLHVSAGLGTSQFAPLRFACRPEASLLLLQSRDARIGPSA